MLDRMPPDSGVMKLFGKESSTLGVAEKRSLGVITEDLALLEELNGYDFLTFMGKIYKMPAAIVESRISDLFAFFFDDPGDLKKRISKYSTGMKKKIAFCAAVLHTPDLLILDEPFSGLDPLVAGQMVLFLKKYSKPQRTVFLSSHDLSYVNKIATHIGVLDEGKLLFDGTLGLFTKKGEQQLDEALMQMLKPENKELDNMGWL